MTSVKIEPAFPGGFTWRRAWIVWGFVWLGVRYGASMRGAHPLRFAPRAFLRWARMMWLWRSGVSLDDALAMERERSEG
jgi:hypothetical protein